MQARVNGEKREFEEGLTLAQLMERLGVPRERGFAVAVNDAVVPRAQQDEFRPRDGDAIEIIRAVAGG
ncbi:MAG: sulfur carrier protein ThiS [Candidatus Eremiobacteraeota bacterium]|nr:sulfur carrier protein ThiS [Candidatus Eremiobacteraeota bacterium]MBV8355128.1 sulfur carrier protein ThiS [Candidatus Eremiobacteraeota bacterium]